MRTRVQTVYEEGVFEMIEYTPSIFKPLLYYFEKMYLVRRIRFLLEYIHREHYKVYYLLVNSEFVGHCVVAPGGRRLSSSTRNDIVIGPYYVKEQYRGKGYSKILIELSLKYCSFSYEYAYDWIEKNNLPSINASLSNNFKKVGELNVVGLRRKLVLVENGENNVYRFNRGEVENE